MSDVSELQIIEIVYIGERLIDGGKLAKCYIPHDALMKMDADEDNKVIEKFASNFEHKRTETKAPRIISAVYTMKCILEDDGRIKRCIQSSATFVRMLPHPFKSVWDGQTDAAHMQISATRQLKRLEEKSYLKDDMNRLRAYYEQVPYSDRAAFEMVVLKALRSGIK